MNVPNAVIYIIEDDPSFRKSMERLIRASGYEVVAFESARPFLSQVAIRHPACLVLDVQLPDIDGFQLQQKLLENGIHLPIIFMTGHGTIPMGVQAMKDGAVDFLPKPFEKKELLDAIVKALARDTQNVRKASEKREINALMETLTPREKEVMRQLISGKLNKQIAYDLGITERTIKFHRGKIMQKTKVSSIAELVRLADKVHISPVD